MEIQLNPAKIVRLMLLIISILAIMHIAQLVTYFYINDEDIFDFVEMVDFDYEANLPSFYSVFSILYCAILLGVIARFKRGNADHLHWLGLMFIFLFLALDEGIALHEEIGDFTETFIEVGGIFYFAWVIPYAVLLSFFLLAYARFVFRLPASTRYQFIIAGCIFVGGAMGVESISAAEADLAGTETIRYSVLYTIEELMEMLAIVLFAYSLMKYIQNEIKSVSFTF